MACRQETESLKGRKQMKKISRRRFIRDTAIVGTAIITVPTLLIRKAPAAWTPGTTVHPNVDNLKVVGTIDSIMTRGTETDIPWPRQEELVVKERVWEGIDRLVCGLTGLNSPEKAWNTIFVKPPGKSWSDTVVAIKTNSTAQQHTRSAVMSKVCHALTDLVGVNAGNIHIYDACHGGSMQAATPFSDLPEGTLIEGQWGGFSGSATVNGPWPNAGDTSDCLKQLEDRTVDVLVNISMCKGHSERFGGFTMTMKNHFGTFHPRPGHRKGGFEYLLAINQTPQILGQMDAKTGKVLFPRQQLCIVDGLWASDPGPGGEPTHQPNFMAMGVLPPVVDYVVATQFRAGKMGWDVNMEAAARMLTEFGYSKPDLPNNGHIFMV
ncbi:MAG: DUF362 domain-containing protein [Desulfobacterales bacterium]|nr:DUF362 domain-containing protein [Desulfobacterales bacterium]